MRLRAAEKAWKLRSSRENQTVARLNGEISIWKQKYCDELNAKNAGFRSRDEALVIEKEERLLERAAGTRVTTRQKRALRVWAKENKLQKQFIDMLQLFNKRLREEASKTVKIEPDLVAQDQSLSFLGCSESIQGEVASIKSGPLRVARAGSDQVLPAADLPKEQEDSNVVKLSLQEAFHLETSSLGKLDDELKQKCGGPSPLA